MPRIRSIHPGLFTDEVYMAMSMTAKAAWPGLWTECDDHGAFEWKPIVLKARLFPADQVDMTMILAEFIQRGAIVKCEIDGRTFGLVRNFCRYQRPKKPKYNIELPPDYHHFVGIASSSKGTEPEPVPNQFRTGMEPVPNQFRTGTEKVAQMEEEGGRREEEKAQQVAARARDLSSHVPAWERIRGALCVDPDDPNWFAQHGRVAQWLANGWDIDLDILPTVARLVAARQSRGKTPIKRLEFFEDAIADALASRLSSVPITNIDRGNGHGKPSGIVAAGERRIAELEERIRERERGEGAKGAVRISASNSDVQVLPLGRRC